MQFAHVHIAEQLGTPLLLSFSESTFSLSKFNLLKFSPYVLFSHALVHLTLD